MRSAKTLTQAALLTLATTPLAWGHGYLQDPPARGYACKLGLNSDCGAIVWEPQSLEGPDGWPAGGPADGTIAAAGSSNWAPLNAQSADRWQRQPMSAGRQSFTWTFTAPHVSRNWRYFITRPGWDVNAPLSRDAFERKPFCTRNGGMQRPPSPLTHECEVPARSGYHLILAVWDVGDTVASFYNVVDVDFGSGASGAAAGTATPPTPAPPPAPTRIEVGTIHPSMDLGAGDSVSLRLFTAEGESTGPTPGIVIASAAEGRAQVWPRLLAQAVNAAAGPVRAGRPGADGDLVAVAGSNTLWVNEGSEIVRVEVQVLRRPVAAPETGPSVTVDSVPATVEADDQGATLSVLLSATATAQATLVAHAQGVGEIGRASVTLAGGAQAVPLELPGAAAGDYTLVIRAPGLGEAVHGFRVLPPSGGEVGNCRGTAPAGSADPWAAGTAYWAGDLVTFAGQAYRAKWWSLGETPPESDAWAPAASATTASAPAWRGDRSYRAGDTVRYQGEYWRTKWWNRGSAPSLQTGWVRVPAEPCA